jgi:hypothetical protein
VRDLSPRIARLDSDEAGWPDWLRHVNVVDFLEAFDIANISYQKSDEVVFSCPFPGHSHGDERPSAYMNDGSKQPSKTTAWTCFGCKRSGNAISFLAEHEHISRLDASTQLKNRFAPGFVAPRHGLLNEIEQRLADKKIDKTHVVPILPWEMYHKRFGVEWGHYADWYGDEPDVGYMFNRGFTPAMLEEWAIGYDPDSERITIPIANELGQLVGIKGRAWWPNAKPRYITLGDTSRIIDHYGQPIYGFEPYERTLVVFGLDKWGEQSSYVFCEGEIDVMSFWRIDVPAFCIGSSWLSEAQARLIRSFTDRVVMFFDNDKAGSRGLWGYTKDDGEYRPGAVEMLERFVRVSIAPRHMLDANVLMRNGRHGRMRQLIADAEPALVAQRRLALL